MRNFLTTSLVLAVLATLASVLACDRSPAGITTPPYSHTLPPGQSNEDLITGESFHRLMVETVYMPGHAPSEFALEQLAGFLGRWLDKSEIVIHTPRQIASGGQASYSADDVRALEAEHRTAFADPDAGMLATFNIVVDGEYSSGNVLGIAYFNTSTAYFGGTIARISGGLTQPRRRDVEATIWLHEYGHLMGLVDMGTPMQQEHRDDPNGAHCMDDACIMYHAFNNADLLGNLLGLDIPDLDPHCAADVRALH
jgi:hypothetical protein